MSERIDESVGEELAREDHHVSPHSAMGVRSIKTVVIDPRTGVLMADAAPATDSYAIGWSRRTGTPWRAPGLGMRSLYHGRANSGDEQETRPPLRS